VSTTTDGLVAVPLERRRILIVEDEALVAADIEQRLEALGYDVCGVADTCGGAISDTLALKPDLVLMDIHLIGDRDGVHAATQIRESSGIPVVFLTAHADDDTLARLRAAAPFGFILKPFAERELKATIEVAFYRQEAEIQSLAAERWLVTSLSSIGDGVIAIDIQGKVKFINPIAEVMTGWPRKSALGRDIIDVFTLEEHGNYVSVPDLLALAFREGAAIYLESGYSLIVRDGRKFHIADSIAVIRDDRAAITGWVITFRDITSMFEAEREERYRERNMTEALRLQALSLLAGGVARDFNKFLYEIVTGTSVGRGILDKMGGEALTRFGELLDRIDGAAGNGAHLCSQLLACAGQIRLPVEIVELNGLTRAAVEAFERDVAKSTNLVVDLANDLPLVRADAGQLRQIIVSLLLNASEALQGDPGRIVVQTTRFNADAVFFSECRVGDGLPAGEYVLLKITDSGCGMAPELMTRIFDPFFTTKPQRRGLSLAVAAGILRSCGGALCVDSTFGRGSCFMLAFPAETPRVQSHKSAIS